MVPLDHVNIDHRPN